MPWLKASSVKVTSPGRRRVDKQCVLASIGGAPPRVPPSCHGLQSVRVSRSVPDLVTMRMIKRLFRRPIMMKYLYYKTWGGGSLVSQKGSPVSKGEVF